MTVIISLLLFWSSLTSLTISAGVQEDDIVFQLLRENTEQCKDKNRKQLKEVVDAKLQAHRCMIRDVPVKVPEPDDIIVDYIFPSHIVVPRCTGVCLEKSGYTCHAKKKPKIVTHQVVLYSVNGTQICKKIDLEHQRGPCRCSCDVTAKSCSPAQVYDSDQCRCTCGASHNHAKYTCSLDKTGAREWDNKLCACVCRDRDCGHGWELDKRSCTCRKVVSTCSISPVNIEAAHPSRLTTYIGIGALSLVAVTILITLYYMLSRKRTYNDLRDMRGEVVGQGGPATAYTITINSQSQERMEEHDSEDKTRF